MCMFCKSKDLIQTVTNHVVNYKECVIIVKNVPCEECEQCGEKYYSSEVVRQLDVIVNEAKKLMQEVSILDYNKLVA